MLGTVIAVVAGIIVLLVIAVIVKAVRIVQQGFVGVITRFGEFKDIKNPGLTFIVPFIEVMKIVDVRETPRTGDRQQVITRDNVAVIVNATIFSQVVDVRLALFTNSDYLVSVDNLARTSVRAVFGSITLDEAFSQRERIGTMLQTQMEEATDKWGVRINRVEVLEITPPEQILQAMALQKQADQEKRARILESEGQQQSAVNVADGQRQAAIKEAEGAQQSDILRAQGRRQALILEAEGRAQAIASVYAAIKLQQPDPTLVAILQLDTLSKFAESANTKLIIPAESAALLGRGPSDQERDGRRADDAALGVTRHVTVRRRGLNGIDPEGRAVGLLHDDRRAVGQLRRPVGDGLPRLTLNLHASGMRRVTDRHLDGAAHVGHRGIRGLGHVDFEAVMMELPYGERSKGHERDRRDDDPRPGLEGEGETGQRQDEGDRRAEADEDGDEGVRVHFAHEAEPDDGDPEQNCKH